MTNSCLSDAHTHLKVLGILYLDSLPSPTLVPKEHNNEFLAVLSEFPTVTQVCGNDLPIKHDLTHRIETTGSLVSARTRRLASERLKVAHQEFEHVTVGNRLSLVSSWSSPLHMVQKKTPGDWCPCGDYRALKSRIATLYHTSRTLRHRSMVPPSFRRSICYGRITRSLLTLQTFQRQLSLLCSDSLSFFRYHLGSGTQRRHSSALWTKSSVAFTFCFIYIDDLLIASSSPEGHKQHLRHVLERLSAHGININPQKCIFGVESLDFFDTMSTAAS